MMAFKNKQWLEQMCAARAMKQLTDSQGWRTQYQVEKGTWPRKGGREVQERRRDRYKAGGGEQGC